MNFKDKLVSKLLDIGKKHRILVYPMLALVAVVTAISHVICWGRGNGKKMVASIMVVALLITQSLFLTSSAVIVHKQYGMLFIPLCQRTGQQLIHGILTTASGSLMQTEMPMPQTTERRMQKQQMLHTMHIQPHLRQLPVFQRLVQLQTLPLL